MHTKVRIDTHLIRKRQGTALILWHSNFDL